MQGVLNVKFTFGSRSEARSESEKAFSGQKRNLQIFRFPFLTAAVLRAAYILLLVAVLILLLFRILVF